jgi:calcium-dependent protein kinase
VAATGCGFASLELDRRRRQPAESLSLIGGSSKTAESGAHSDLYTMGRTLGEGAFAVVKEATEKATGIVRAIKLVDKKHSDKAALEREMNVMRVAGRHRHIVSLVDEFELPNAWALVLELVKGGEVFDRICEGGLYSEADAAAVALQVARALEHLHGHGIVHRDLKPENLLLVDKSQHSDVKLCDFGLAQFFGEGMPEMVGRTGTIAYMAPEMLAGKAYDESVDLWALGVILFILLGGYHPFDPQGSAPDEEVARRVQRGAWSFDDPAWKPVSSDAKSIIHSLLAPDPAKRARVADLLASPWVLGHSASPAPLPDSTTAQLRAFNDMRRTWRAAIRAASLVGRTPAAGVVPRGNTQKLHKPSLPPGALEELKAAFQTYDLDRSGTIELEELRKVMRSLGAPEGQAELVFKTADVLNTGNITFDEFCAAVGPIYAHSEMALKRAFNVFDQDGNGTIDQQELRVMMTKLRVVPADVAPETIQQLFNLADTDGNGKITFEEFVSLFKSDPKETKSQR